MFYTRLFETLREYRSMPCVTVDLMHAATSQNDPFFERIVRDFYVDANRRHRKLPLFRKFTQGVALCVLPSKFDDYFMMIEASARRNYKKAVREGCSFRPIDINNYLIHVGEIRGSSDIRQGKLVPEHYRSGEPAKPFDVHRSLNQSHDYVYFGAFLRDELIGYAYCMVAGEFCGIEHILGHAKHLSLGVVPQLIIGMAKYLYENHSLVKYYVYGSYFGGSETMKRFKRKFGFLPYKVRWQMNAGQRPPLSASTALIQGEQ